MTRFQKLLVVGLAVLLVIAVGGGVELLKMTASVGVVLIIAGGGIALLRPKLGWQLVAGSIVAILGIGMFGPAAVAYLHMLFGSR
jgi:hypothetical protein